MRRLHFTRRLPVSGRGGPPPHLAGHLARRTLPRDADVDLESLAQRFEMAGGNIRNVALAAAFLAADDGDAVRMSHVIHATQREYQKTGKLLRERNFDSPCNARMAPNGGSNV